MSLPSLIWHIVVRPYIAKNKSLNLIAKESETYKEEILNAHIGFNYFSNYFKYTEYYVNYQTW